ncbi:uncharacterized protein si:dkey-171c9.3 isoform X2 [Alosa sapidissima]|nr:uncharacterized protein si:dkey-171c9.3 isoform X2 [Alosa sapidissima]XP_041926293.1 uncharacterized protein si:dkey-171c9.3 isoform X2 [Alosa sapidissima]
MDAQDWINSNHTLCELQAVSQADTTKMPMEIVFDVPLSPPPSYDQASILWSLGLYSHTLDEALKRGHAADQQSMDFLQRKSSSVTAAVHNFAQALASDIISSATHPSVGDTESEKVLSPTCGTDEGRSTASHCFFDPNANVLWGDDQECKTSSYTDEEKLAEYLTSMIFRMALKEVAEHGSPRTSVLSTAQSTHHRETCSRHPYDERMLSERGQSQEICDENMDTHWEESTFEPPASSRARGASGSSRTIGSLLSQSSLASNQSLDYPDAPPTTPLIPGVTQSRASFCRKLKGGLAKEFLPSPPPPTPNKNPNPSQQLLRGYKETDRDTAEFVHRLMRSLSLECSDEAGFADISGGLSSQSPWTNCPELSHYADQLSADIIKYVTTSDEGEDFVDRLMWSLSLEYPECIEDTPVKENNSGPLNKAHCDSDALNDFADELATDIIGCAIESYSSLTAFQKSLLPTAERWAEEILQASYREMIDPDRTKDINTSAQPNRRSVKSEAGLTSSDVGVEASTRSQIRRPTSEVHSLQRTGSQEDDPTGAGRLRDLAEALLATAFIQALPELQRAVLHPGAGPMAQGPPDYTSGSLRTSLQPSKRVQASLSSGNPGQATGALAQVDNAADCALDSYAEHVALEVIDGSLKLASKYLVGDGKACSLRRDGNGSWYSEGEVTQRRHGPRVRVLLGSQMCRTTNDLKGVLMWAAASQLGIQTLTLVVADHQLQAQFSSVAHDSHLLGLTVGDLMTSLLQHCTHLSQVASRGSSLSGVHPLTYLQELSGVSRKEIQHDNRPHPHSPHHPSPDKEHD